MLYVSGVYALNLPCKLDLQGDWHMSALDWNKVTFLNSADSIYKDYGIEQSYSNSLVNLYNVNKANYIRACLDLLEQGKFSLLNTFMHKWLDTDDKKLLSEIFSQVSKLSTSDKWSEIDDLMCHEYMMKWVRFKVEKVIPNIIKISDSRSIVKEQINQINVNDIAEYVIDDYLRRTELNDLYLLMYICRKYWKNLEQSVKKRIKRAMTIKDLEYVEFVVNTQASFIDNQALANDYFKFFNELALLSDYSKSSIEVTKESK